MDHHPIRDLATAAPGPAPTFGAWLGAAPAPCLGRSFDSCTRPDP
ncbi:hypothetical protein EDD99_4149 [Streptomyces sp. 846.5]|nr:hypothetical protein EDD99_4149 [Streptomyces sp. 846.5]